LSGGGHESPFAGESLGRHEVYPGRGVRGRQMGPACSNVL
jgi:hypothetical protein